MKKILYATALGVLALFLSACGGEEPEAVQPDSYSMTEDYVLSLQVGNTTGLLSGVLEDESQVRGVEVTLSAPPVVVDEVFYFPLEDVVEILGGTCEIQVDLARVELFGDTTLYQIGEPVILVNGESRKVEPDRPAFREEYVPIPAQQGAPRWIDDVFYVSNGFYVEDGVGFFADQYPEKDMIVLNHQLWDEITVEGISAAEGTMLPELPKEVTKGFRKTRTIPGEADGWYDFDVYQRPGMELYVMNVRPEYEGKGYGYDDEVCAILVTESGIPTARGLQVGDPENRLDLLYGNLDHPLNLAFHLIVEVEDGKVAWYALYNRNWLVETNPHLP